MFLSFDISIVNSKRKNAKLCFMYKESNNLVPKYIIELIPPVVGNRSQYQMRNSQNYGNVHVRTGLLQKTCIPSSVFLLNDLEQEIRNSTTFGSSKLKLSSIITTR